MLAGQEHALQVASLTPSPALLGGLDRAADFDDPDIVVQHVDPAERRDAGTDYASAVVGTRHIPSDCLADAALRFNHSLGLEGPHRGYDGCEDLCSLAREEHRSRLAKPQPVPLERPLQL
jgi:hypothetical protein